MAIRGSDGSTHRGDAPSQARENAGRGPAPRLHRALLRLYSPAFRRDFGLAALDVLARDLEDARGPGARFHGLLRRAAILADFALHGVLDRLAGLRHTLAAGADGFWNGWSHDVRQAGRSAGRRLGFTVVAVASLAIGVGANGVVFAVVDTFVLRDIPGVEAPDRLLELNLVLRDGRTAGWNYPDFLDVADGTAGLEAIALAERGTVSLSDGGPGDRVMGLFVTSGYFRTVGAPLRLGRDFGPEIDRDPGRHAVTILSHRTWQERYGGDPDVVGRVIRVNRAPHTVVGVASETYRGHEFGMQPALYLPITSYPPGLGDPDRFFGSRGTLWVGSALARARPGVGPDEVNASLRTVMARLAGAYPASNEGRGATAVRAALLPAEGRAAASVAFTLLGALMLLVLAAASANVGGMLLARASSRTREMAVRMALGSGRARIVRHLLTEAMAIFLLGGLAGVFVAVQGLAWFESTSSLPTDLPVRLDFALDWRVLAFGLALTTGAGLVFGLLPALRATRGDVAAGLREGGDRGGTSRLRRAFVAGQVGVSVVLLTSAALFLRSLGATDRIDPGMDLDGIYLTGFDLALEGYDDPELGLAFVDRVLERARAMPDVAGATVAGDFPLDGGSSAGPVWPDGAGGPDDAFVQSYYAHVSEGYFETLGIPVLSGRTFRAEEGRTTPLVAVVDRVLAERAWPGQTPLGRTVEFGLERRRYEVVGVVENTRADMITDRPSPHVFTLLDQDFERDLYLAVRGRDGSADFVARLRQELLAEDPRLALGPTRPLADLAALGTLPNRIVASVAGTLGALALFLAALGVYGVVAFMVTRRTREIGVRMALGSSRAGVLGRVLADGLRLAVPGVVVGLPVAMALAAVLRGMLQGVSPVDPMAYAGVAAVLIGIVVAASAVPARRASTVAPAEALRSE
ncbi:MAG: ADOP family duplicated permease [Longimicrobiales bacterium]